MDKVQALHEFWNSFDIPAIDENSALDPWVLQQLNISYPRITYGVSVGNVSSGSVVPSNLTLSASLWYRSKNWADITRKADEIAAFIGYGGRTYKLDNGYMHVMLPSGTVYSRMSDTDDTLRRIVFNIEVMFLTST